VIVRERGNFGVLRSKDALDDRQGSMVEPLAFFECGGVFANDTEAIANEGYFDGITGLSEPLAPPAVRVRV